MSAILAGTLLLTATGLFSQAVGFVYRMLLSRLIGAETMGLYQLVMPVYSLLMSVTAVGLTVAVSTLSARYHALEDDGTVKAVLRRALGAFSCWPFPWASRWLPCPTPSPSTCWGTPAPVWAW